jgi:aconitate hydratase
MAEKGAKEDLAAAKVKHKEVFEFLASASARYNIGFWKPGSGTIHPILFENYTLIVRTSDVFLLLIVF